MLCSLLMQSFRKIKQGFLKVSYNLKGLVLLKIALGSLNTMSKAKVLINILNGCSVFSFYS